MYWVQNQVRLFSSDFSQLRFAGASKWLLSDFISRWLSELRRRTSLLLSMFSFSFLFSNLSRSDHCCHLVPGSLTTQRKLLLWAQGQHLRADAEVQWLILLLCVVPFLPRIGRYTKSLDTSRFFCGKCKGSLVMVPLTQKHGTRSVPHVWPFAVYVQKYYRKIKQEMARISHGDMMKTLGRNYKAVKNS